MPLPKDWKPPIIVDVNVKPDGDANLLGVTFKNPGDPEEVKDVLTTKLAQLKAANASDPKQADNIELILHPAPGTKWDKLAPLYDAALRAKFPKVSFAQTT